MGTGALAWGNRKTSSKDSKDSKNSKASKCSMGKTGLLRVVPKTASEKTSPTNGFLCHSKAVCPTQVMKPKGVDATMKLVTPAHPKETYQKSL